MQGVSPKGNTAIEIILYRVLVQEAKDRGFEAPHDDAG
jgi:hypothetical protein